VDAEVRDRGRDRELEVVRGRGIAVADKAAVICTCELARAAGFRVEQPPRTTWRGTPLHELWLADPDGTLVEVYARLSEDELAHKPASLEPTPLA
jgi:catechol 2,3-dioxygenase-like lactoylglutathione lyase family enzyme